MKDNVLLQNGRYISELENQVKHLKQEVRELKAKNKTYCGKIMQ